jgi:predicted component of type VI protein secretion system
MAHQENNERYRLAEEVHHASLEIERLKAQIGEVIAHPDYTNPEGMVRKLRDILSNTEVSDLPK